MLNPKINTIKLSTNEHLRYIKQIKSNNISINGQKRIKSSKVLIVGAGGLGCPIAIYLAASGIGSIGILDEDKVELSNLNRQIIYKETDINKLKAISAKNQIHQFNKNCRIITHTHKLNERNSKEIISYYDIVIDTTDNFETKYIINTTCYKLHKPYIYGAVDQFIGQIGTFNYKDGIKYHNLYHMNLKLISQNCNTNGVMGITTGYIGILQAVETIKIIIGYKNKLNNSIFLYNLINTQTKIKKLYSQKEIINQIRTSRKIETKLDTILNKKINDQKFIIIDIKNYKDFKNKHKKKSINIPFYAFKLQKTVKFLKKQNNKRSFYISCETLNKSLIVSHILKNKNLDSKLIKQ
uniref:Molybdopterin biosynthesis protein n=1 Tax=Chondria tumulosa TaxID=2740715 RepID=A0A896SQS2_9FLOR|nr:molybdopterin biosynthesis protein [Chondria tumulosa]QSD57186.1 molybdopterin biosynthesis protein [Chondria tumulosa]